MSETKAENPRHLVAASLCTLGEPGRAQAAEDNRAWRCWAGCWQCPGMCCCWGCCPLLASLGERVSVERWRILGGILGDFLQTQSPPCLPPLARCASRPKGGGQRKMRARERAELCLTLLESAFFPFTITRPLRESSQCPSSESEQAGRQQDRSRLAHELLKGLILRVDLLFQRVTMSGSVLGHRPCKCGVPGSGLCAAYLRAGCCFYVFVCFFAFPWSTVYKMRKHQSVE